MNIREVCETDYHTIAKIWEQGIKTNIATFRDEVPSREDWNLMYDQRCRIVAEIDEMIVGWVAVMPHHGSKAYKGVGEISIYISPNHQNEGIGTALMNAVIEKSESIGYRMLESVVIAENEHSRALHEKCGFRVIGQREKICKTPDGKWHDTILFEKRSRVVEPAE